MQIYDRLYSRSYRILYNKLYMSTIITTTQLQQKIGEITANIDKKSYVVTNRGQGKIVLLPYFDGCDGFIEDYMEDFEIMLNKEKLEKQWKESLASGESDLVI